MSYAKDCTPSYERVSHPSMWKGVVPGHMKGNHTRPCERASRPSELHGRWACIWAVMVIYAGLNLWKSPPPPRFFSNLEKTGENFVKIFFLPEPNSFPDILKKKSCKSVKRLGHSNYVLEVYGGGWFSTPHIFSTCSSTRGGVILTPPL